MWVDHQMYHSVQMTTCNRFVITEPVTEGIVDLIGVVRRLRSHCGMCQEGTSRSCARCRGVIMEVCLFDAKQARQTGRIELLGECRHVVMEP